MSESRDIQIMEEIYGENDRRADELNAALTADGIFCVNVMGAPGAGKTTVITGLINALPAGTKAYVVEGDIESDIDTVNLRKLGISAGQINTYGACHLDAPAVAKKIAEMRPEPGSVVFIENIGNLVCPAEFMIGEHAKMLITTTADGSDKPYKYPLAFEKADVIVVNKTDLEPYTDFDRKFFLDGVDKLNRKAPVIFVSGRQKANFDELAKWLTAKIQESLQSR